MAGQGLLESTALAVNEDLPGHIATYKNQQFMKAFKVFVAALEDDEYNDGSGSDPFNPLGISADTIGAMTQVFDSMPWMSDHLPREILTVDSKLPTSDSTKFTADSTYTGAFQSKTLYSDYISTHINNIIGDGDNSIFISRLLAILGYTKSINDMINAAVNGETLNAQTFTSMDALITANISAVSRYTQEWGQDLLNTGLLYDFSRLDIIGSPQSLLERMVDTNTLVLITTELEEAGIDVYTLTAAINDNPDLVMKTSAQKRVYDVFVTIIDQKLLDILFVFGITTTNIGTLADLLDVTKMFPASFNTITSLNNGTLELIYLEDTANIAPWVSALSTDLVSAMPADIAKANVAFSISLQQIKDIHKTDPETLATQAQSLETNQGLSNIDSLTEALPASVTNYYKNSLGKGSGPDNTFYVTDGVGSVTGIPHNENFIVINDAIDILDLDANVIEFYDIFEVSNTLTGGGYLTGSIPNPDEVEIPVGLPAEGIYSNRATAMDALLVEAQALVVTIESTNQTLVDNANAALNSSLNQIELELQTLTSANIQFVDTHNELYNAPDGTLPPDPSVQTTLAFATNLHSFGKETTKGSIAVILESMVTDTTGGEAIVAAMREGRNLKKIGDAGVTADNIISTEPEVVEEGSIISSTYTL